MARNTLELIEAADVGSAVGLQALEAGVNIDSLPAGVISGTTLIDYSAAPDVEIRAGVSLALLFASRVATTSTQEGDNEDDWLARYTANLSDLGFGISGYAVTTSRFKKIGVSVHKAIIPFLTVAFGGAAVGPVILAALDNLQDVDEGSPWIALFDRSTRRFDVREMHFAAVSADHMQTQIRYAVARLHVDTRETKVLFFRITKANAEFESATTTLTANNSLLATIEPLLREKLAHLIGGAIAAANVG